VLAAAALLAVTGGLWVNGNRSPAGTSSSGAAAAVTLPESTAKPSAACAVTYALKRDSGREFHADLTVKNAGGQRVENWRLTFAFPGDQRLVDARPVGFAQTGRDVVIQPAGKRPIAAGDSLAMRVTGRYQKSNPLPTTFAVDGTECEALVSGAPPDTSPPTARSGGSGAGTSGDDDSGKGKGGKGNSGKGGGDDEDDD
jgi:serine/threonine-protein kinase